MIVPSFTWVSSANAVEYTGAEVVFCDINLKTFNMLVSYPGPKYKKVAFSNADAWIIREQLIKQYNYGIS